MAGKIVLGKTHEDLEREEARKQREKEAEIQNSIAERQAKIEALHKKQSTNKIIIISAISAISAGLIFFGTYNTFFKKGITMEEDVAPFVSGAVANLNFPSPGLDNYLHDNIDTLFYNYASVNSSSVNQLIVDKNSCYVNRVRPLSGNVAQVYFSVDVESIENDTVITDAELLKKIKQQQMNDTLPQGSYRDNPIMTTDTYDMEPVSYTSDFKISNMTYTSDLKIVNLSNKAEESSNEEKTKPAAKPADEVESSEAESSEDAMPVEDESIVEPSDDSIIDDPIEEPIDDSDTSIDEPIDDDFTADSTPENNPTTETPSNTQATNKIKDANGNIIEYYYGIDGNYYKTGNVTRQRYNFVIVIEYFYKYDGDTPVAGGFRPVSNLILYTLNDISQTEFNEANPIEESELLKFNGVPLDENTTEKIRIKVDKTLQDLYEMRDVSQDFMNYRTFNTYDATYVQLDDIVVYAEPNLLGFNTSVEYTILTNQGFIYKIQTYMKVEESGNSYVIKDIL